MKLTPIFPAHIKPVRVGVYKTGASGERGKLIWWSYWDGKRWGWHCDSWEEAKHDGQWFFADQEKRWQGILK